ncbi:MAG: hypothetical protein KAX47_06920 [Zoogloea sp.]|uniref:hypothetical protein n=1 Tax=Zoogloea sp. TaxID=49181 RepID=UPI001B5260C2|nr:hypothetical protein [Zoogloea sp.]MBP8266269.1 hypothetical protein [Zoogloea sp.]HQA11586.1 hypothetical protein [Zoogloea sp.]
MQQGTRQPVRKIMAVLLATAMAGLPLASEARLGGGNSGHSMAMTRSASAPTLGGASSRLGSGGSAGMTRPDVMDRARSNAPANAPAYGSPSAGYYPGGAPAPAPRSGPGWGTVAGAAAVGAAAGYMLGDHNSPQAGVQPGNPQTASGQPVSRDLQVSGSDVGAALPQPHNAGGLGTVLGLLLLTGAGFWAFQRYQAAQKGGAAQLGSQAASFKTTNAPASGSNPPTGDADIERIALKAFNELQDANNRGDLPFLKSRMDDLLFQQTEADIRQRGGQSHTQIVSMKAEPVDITDQGNRRLVSIRYTGLIVENPDSAPERLDEVWHFVDENRGVWRLAGIEQV